MALPYDPHQEEAVAIAPLIKAMMAKLGQVGVAGHCSRCGDHIWINEETGKFVAANEVEILCPPCAVKFQEGEK